MVWPPADAPIQHALGHPVTYDWLTLEFRYVDGEVMDAANQRPCVQCGEPATADGHDPCIANLPGVAFACCGHGVTPAYADLGDGRVVEAVNGHELRAALAAVRFSEVQP